MAVKRRIEDPLGFEWSRKNIVELSPTVGFVDTIVGNTNLIVHQLLESGATRYPVLLTLFKKANNQIIVSLRSKKGEAVRIAEKLQGGGHPNASGAVLPRSVRNVAHAIEYLQRVFNPNPSVAPLNSLEGLFASLETFKLAGIIAATLCGGFIAAHWGLTAPMGAYVIPAFLALGLSATLCEPPVVTHSGCNRTDFFASQDT